MKRSHPATLLCAAIVLSACGRPSGPTPTAAGPLGREWSLGEPMLTARSEMPAVLLNDLVYVPGGFGGADRLEAYDPRTDGWTSLADLPQGRHHLMAAPHGTRLYVFGGSPGLGWSATDEAWVYLPESDEWQAIAPMPEKRMAGAAVTIGDVIYVVGGTGGETMLAYHVTEDRWEVLPGPRQPREHVVAVEYQGELWVLGGRWGGVGEIRSVEIYAPREGTWREGPGLNVARGGFAAAVVEGSIAVGGGEVIQTGRETLGSVEIFDPTSNLWREGPSLPFPVHGVPGVAYDERFLVLGGSDSAGGIVNYGRVQILELAAVP